MFESRPMQVAETIRTILEQSLAPASLEVLDESASHAGHAGARPGGQTHFRIKLVSARFEGLSRVQRHQEIYRLLASLMNRPVHALAMELKTPAEAAN